MTCTNFSGLFFQISIIFIKKTLSELQNVAHAFIEAVQSGVER